MIDQMEWTHWLKQHGPAMLLLARQRVQSVPDAQDIVQDAFIRFWNARDRVADPKAYLFACVRSCAMDYRRAGSRRGRREESVARAEAGAPLFVASGLEHEERRAAIEAAVARLPEPQREVLALKIWAKLTFVQIGQTLGIPADTAASRYRYALTRLREQLAEELIQ